MQRRLLLALLAATALLATGCTEVPGGDDAADGERPPDSESVPGADPDDNNGPTDDPGATSTGDAAAGDDTTPPDDPPPTDDVRPAGTATWGDIGPFPYDHAERNGTTWHLHRDVDAWSAGLAEAAANNTHGEFWFEGLVPGHGYGIESMTVVSAGDDLHEVWVFRRGDIA